jgi:hypothetical protein
MHYGPIALLALGRLTSLTTPDGESHRITRMARRIVLSPGARWSTSFAARRRPTTPDERYPELEQAVLELAPDEALFVQRPGSTGTVTDRTSRLRTTLDRILRRHSVLCIPDSERGGVWVYRPPSVSVVVGVAVGPDKEAEVRSRSIDD